MAQFAPIDYGPLTSPDLSGLRSQEQATAEHGARNAAATSNLGQSIESAAGQFTQNTAHRQALEATADAARGTEQALSVIESNPYYITRDELSKHLSPDKVDELWNVAKAKNLITTASDGTELAATHAVGREMYAEMARDSREKAAEKISLPGWRSEFLKSAETEALNKQERYIDPKLAHYAVEYDKAKSMESWRNLADAAREPEDFRSILAGVRGSPNFSPDEKQALLVRYGKQADTVIADKALVNPIANEEVLKKELVNLQGPHAADLYPNSDAKERLELTRQVKGGLQFAQAQRDHQTEMQKRADKESDDTLNASVMRGVLTGNVKADTLFAKPGQPGTGAADQLLSQLKTREGVENFYHFVESYNRNAQAQTKQDRPGVFQALSTLYAKDTDGFRQAFESQGPVRIPGWENLGAIDLARDLSPESYKHWAEKYTGLADKETAKEDSANEGRFQTRLGAAMTNEEGGRVKASDWLNPQWRVEHADMEEYVSGQLKEAQSASLRKTGHKLSVGEEYKTMLQAAKNYSDNPTPGRVYGRNEHEGLGIETKDGVIKIGSLERSYMVTARHATGTVGALDIQKEGADFHDNYKAPIEQAWTQVFSKPPDLEDSVNLYYLAKTIPGDKQTQILKAVQLASQRSAGKNNGGTK